MSDDVLVESFAYDAAGNLNSSTDAQGVVTLREFDQAGRMIKQVENAGALVVPFGEDSSPSFAEGS